MRPSAATRFSASAALSKGARLTRGGRPAAALLFSVLFGSCRAFLSSDEASFRDRASVDAGRGDVSLMGDAMGPDVEVVDGAPHCTGCWISNECVAQGQRRLGSPCERCDRSQAATAWSIDDGGACDDGSDCTTDDRCRGKTCQGMPRCEPPLVCVEGTRRCVEACDPGTCLIDGRCWPAGFERPGDVCWTCSPNEDNTSWSPNPGRECDDGEFCTVADSCSDSGICTGRSRDCDDGLACTDDRCEGGQCENPVSSGCAIQETCIQSAALNPDHLCEICDPTRDTRAYSGREGLECDDGATCTEEDACSSTGVCTGNLLREGARCLAGFCLGDGRCGGELLAAGAFHTCALRNGELYCFGRNHFGQLGDGTTRDRPTPMRIGAESGWSQVVAGNAHTCGRRGGALYCWGKDSHGEVGNGPDAVDRYSTPQQVGTGRDWGQLAAGAEHTCAIRNGALFCWGRNNSGQLGDGTLEDRPSPVQVGEEADWTQISAGTLHTCGIRGSALYCWGYNAWGQLGDTTTATRREPVQILPDAGWSSLCAGDAHSCGLRSGNLYCWGSNSDGQLAATGGDQLQPLAALLPGGTASWEWLLCGSHHSCALSGTDLRCWGRNDSGQLGDGSTTSSAYPRALGLEATGAAGGRDHTCAIRGGAFYCWGANAYGQLGDGTMSDQLLPVLVQLPEP